MKIIIFEENLLWAGKLKKRLEALGHTPYLYTKESHDYEDASIAIFNLSSTLFPLQTLLKQMQDKGVFCIAHAGHKEKEKLSLGNEIGFDKVVTNGMISEKLSDVLKAHVK